MCFCVVLVLVEDLGEFMITGIGCMVVVVSRGSERDECFSHWWSLCYCLEQSWGCHRKLE